MKRCRQTLQAKRKKKKKINCIKFVFIRKDITTKIFAFDSDIDLIIGNAFIRVKFVEIIQNRDDKNWPTLLNFDNGEKFIQEDYLFIKGYRICIRIYFIIYLDIKLIDWTKYKNHRLSVLNFENDKKKKKKNLCKEIVSCDYLSEKIFDICIGYASDIYFAILSR